MAQAGRANNSTRYAVTFYTLNDQLNLVFEAEAYFAVIYVYQLFLRLSIKWKPVKFISLTFISIMCLLRYAGVPFLLAFLNY